MRVRLLNKSKFMSMFQQKAKEQAKPDPDADYVDDEDYGYDESEEFMDNDDEEFIEEDDDNEPV